MKKYLYTGTTNRCFSVGKDDFFLKPGKEQALPDCSYVELMVAQKILVPVAAPAAAPKSSTPKTTLTDGLS